MRPICSHWIGPDLHNLAGAAKRLSISEDTLKRHVDAGNIRAVNVGTGKHRDLRFLDSELDRFVEARAYQPLNLPRRSAKPTRINRKVVGKFDDGVSAKRK